MSHDRGWRAVCLVTIWIPRFHFEMGEIARGVTAMVVGSGALLGLWDLTLNCMMNVRISGAKHRKV